MHGPELTVGSAQHRQLCSWLGSLDRSKGIVTEHSIIQVLHLRAVAHGTQAGGNKRDSQLLQSAQCGLGRPWAACPPSLSPFDYCFYSQK